MKSLHVCRVRSPFAQHSDSSFNADFRTTSFFSGVDPFSFSRAGSANPNPDVASTEAGESLQLTPRAAAAVNARGDAQAKQPAKKRQKALAVDKVIELDWQAARLAGKERFKEVN